jgi:hypothetical protein
MADRAAKQTGDRSWQDELSLIDLAGRSDSHPTGGDGPLYGAGNRCLPSPGFAREMIIPNGTETL